MQVLDGSQHDFHFRAAVQHTPVFKRKLIIRSLRLSLKELQNLSSEMETSIDILDGEMELDAVNPPAKSIYVNNRNEATQYYHSFLEGMTL